MYSNGAFVMAEIKSAWAYILHTFWDEEQFKNWMRVRPHGTMVKPSEAKGQRDYQVDHLLETELM